ncbi:PaaI family thioesterase [Nocardia lijiangensis]|uniref:PaaI family thioesterase n=1 Tax=Nocardia lijiangensis TaxID=299618 RepID=UPI000A6080B1|nr:PaaI family thioesterase [Nocardia lijiangensis]
MNPLDPLLRAHVVDSFERQAFMSHLGARLTAVEPGWAEITLAYAPTLTQQHGYFHAGVTSAIADTAGGYAALSTFSTRDSILTVDFSLNLLAVAVGDRLVAHSSVVRTGRTITVCSLDVYAVDGESSTHVATGRQTLIRLADRPDR